MSEIKTPLTYSDSIELANVAIQGNPCPAPLPVLGAAFRGQWNDHHRGHGCDRDPQSTMRDRIAKALMAVDQASRLQERAEWKPVEMVDSVGVER